MRTIHPSASPSTRFTHRTRIRLITVGLAAGTAVLIWSVATLVLGLHITVPTGPGALEHEPLQGGPVFFAATIASLVAWGLLELLERFVPAGLSIWTGVGIVFYLLTLPYLPGYTMTERIFLVILHSAVAGTVILGMRRARNIGA